MKIAIASANQGKIKEFKAILEPLGYTLLTAQELNVDMDVVEETGSTFEENAMLKSKYLYAQTNLPSLADDSGLTISVLPDILGIYSARFMGEDTSYDLKNNEILNLLKNKEDRSAYFTSVISFTDHEKTHTFEGIAQGKISHKIQGSQGFGYDPIFIPEGYGITYGLISDKIKNKISHRAKSLNKFSEFIHEK